MMLGLIGHQKVTAEVKLFFDSWKNKYFLSAIVLSKRWPVRLSGFPIISNKLGFCVARSSGNLTAFITILSVLVISAWIIIARTLQNVLTITNYKNICLWLLDNPIYNPEGKTLFLVTKSYCTVQVHLHFHPGVSLSSSIVALLSPILVSIGTWIEQLGELEICRMVISKRPASNKVHWL